MIPQAWLASPPNEIGILCSRLVEMETKAAEAEERVNKLAAAAAKTRSGSLLYVCHQICRRQQYLTLSCPSVQLDFECLAVEPSKALSSHLSVCAKNAAMLVKHDKSGRK